MLSFAAVHLLKPTQKPISKTLEITTTTTTTSTSFKMLLSNPLDMA
jgi:hypothetical protein